MSNNVKWLRRFAGAFGVLALVAVLATWIPNVAAAHGGIDGVGGVHPDDSGLASALGIGTDKLAAAETKVAEAALAQAVADGKLTKEQADRFTLRGLGGRGLMGIASDHDAALAAALGISVDELRAARDKAVQSQLAAAVTAGRITQAQAQKIGRDVRQLPDGGDPHAP